MLRNVFVSLGSFYRFLIIGVICIIHYQTHEGIEKSELKSMLIMYAVLFLYALGASLLKTSKWTAYSELLVIFGLTYWYDYTILYFLLLIPISNLVSSKMKSFDNLVFSIIIATLIYLKTSDIYYGTFAFLGMYFTIGLFQLKFNQIEQLEKQLTVIRKKSDNDQNELVNKLRELDIISKMFEHGRRLNETIEVDELIQQMIEASKEFFNARYACLYIKEGKKYRMVKDSGTNQRHEVPVELHMEEANVHIIKSNMIRVPIKYEGHDWGCLSIYDKRSDIGEMQQKVFFPFQEEDYEVLTVYTEQVMFKMKHAVLLKKYHNLANNDFLTGIPNRRFFMKQFEYLVERAKRGDELTVMIIDIDKFKNFNDHYGHDTGDEALKLVARTLQECLRKIDIIGRFGGEEFAALLPNTNGHDEMIAERIRKRIKDMPFIDTITVSIGVSVFGRDGTTEHELLTKADKALYHSKANGRDQVSYYRSDME